MIHTLQLSYCWGWPENNPLSLFHLLIVLLFWRIAFYSCPAGITLSLHYLPSRENCLFRGVELRVYVDFFAFAGSCEVGKVEIDAVRDTLTDILSVLCIDLAQMEVKRVDFCKNVIVRDQEERALLMALWDKTRKHFYHATRIDPKQCATHNKLYWEDKPHFDVQLYDKEAACQDKGTALRPYERGVLRLEYQICDKHIKYHTKAGRPCDYDTWTDPALRARYLSATEALFYSGDFYNLPRAKTKLTQAVRAGIISQQAIADRIYQFMTYISNYGADAAIQKVSAATARRYIKLLSDIGVNPIPIPRNKQVSFLPNPFRGFFEGGCRD